MELLADLTLIVVVALVGGLLAQRLRQPLIVGFILAGVVVGPFTGGVTVVRVQDIEQLAELGVALLLFSLGLEVSFRELAPVRSVAIAGAAIQIVLTVGLGFAFAYGIGWTWQSGLWLGALISLSSTMVALKTLQAQGRLGTLSSRVMLGMLVVQDLAVIPMMIVLPELNQPAGGVSRVAIATLRSMILLAVIVFVSTRLVPRIMRLVARWNSRELFLLATIAIALGIGYATWRFGASLALGAFIAGLVINESEYAHQALSDVMPLRDLFGMLFFVSVGMLLDPLFLWHHLGTVALLVVTVTAGKSLILAGVVLLFGYRRIVPLAVGLTLFQVGEFAFVLARVGLTSGAIDAELYAVVLNTAVATMTLTPVVSSATPWIYARYRRQRAPAEPLEMINIPAEGLEEHVIVAGAGRVGRTIADALAERRLPCVLIDLEHKRVEHARAAGLAILYGDATQHVVLEAAGLARATAVLVTLPTFADVRAIVRSVRRVREDVPIVARADGPDAVAALSAMGVSDVVSPEFEAAIEMTRQALIHLHTAPPEILSVTQAIHRRTYGLPIGS
jgi:CPA2 family monovalent cation:H+ antiporter-2